MLGFWDNVRKYNVKKLIKIKLGFWDNDGNIIVKTFRDKAWVFGTIYRNIMVKNL